MNKLSCRSCGKFHVAYFPHPSRNLLSTWMIFPRSCPWKVKNGALNVTLLYCKLESWVLLFYVKSVRFQPCDVDPLSAWGCRGVRCCRIFLSNGGLWMGFNPGVIISGDVGTTYLPLGNLFAYALASVPQTVRPSPFGFEPSFVIAPSRVSTIRPIIGWHQKCLVWRVCQMGNGRLAAGTNSQPKYHDTDAGYSAATRAFREPFTKERWDREWPKGNFPRGVMEERQRWGRVKK